MFTDRTFFLKRLYFPCRKVTQFYYISLRTRCNDSEMHIEHCLYYLPFSASHSLWLCFDNYNKKTPPHIYCYFNWILICWNKTTFFILSKGLFSGRIGYLLVYQRWGSSDFVVNNNWGSYYVIGLSIKSYTGIKIKENEAERKKVQK